MAFDQCGDLGGKRFFFPLSSLLTHLDGHEKAFQGRGDGLGNNLGDVGVCIGVTSLVYLLGGVGRLE